MVNAEKQEHSNMADKKQEATDLEVLISVHQQFSQNRKLLQVPLK